MHMQPKMHGCTESVSLVMRCAVCGGMLKWNLLGYLSIQMVRVDLIDLTPSSPLQLLRTVLATVLYKFFGYRC